MLDHLHHLRDRLPLDDRLLSVVSRHPVIGVAEVRTLHISEEIFIVRNDDQLEIGLLLPRLDDVVQRFCQRLDVVPIKIRRWFIQGDQAAIDSKALGQGQSNDNAREDLLPGAASATHIHIHVLFQHADSIIVGPVPFRGLVVGPDKDSIYICSLVRPLPQLFDDTIDLLHLEAVILHNCPKIR